MERAAGADGQHPPAPEHWPKTRELADKCGENIYTTRTLLLALEKEGKVSCTHRSINNSLRWYICTSAKKA
jgi:DNA-binding transcriptional regulator YhcF (GntR family)|uniref:FaeA-like family protein n=2 Tax=Serratia TaxID=613 RepID=A8GKX1_SERP5